MGWLRSYAVVLGVQIIAGYWIYANFPAYRYLVEEGQIVETLSALLFLAAFVVAAGLFMSYRKSNARNFLLVPALIGLIGFLDEIDWGEQILSIAMPVIRGHKINQLHDFIDLAREIFLAQGRIIKLSLFFGTVLLIMVMAFPYREYIVRQISAVPREPLHFTWALFVALGVAAVVLDQEFTAVEIAEFFEELLEMNAAFVLIVATYETFLVIAEPEKSPDTAKGASLGMPADVIVENRPIFVAAPGVQSACTLTNDALIEQPCQLETDLASISQKFAK